MIFSYTPVRHHICQGRAAVELIIGDYQCILFAHLSDGVDPFFGHTWPPEKFQQWYHSTDVCAKFLSWNLEKF